MENVGIQISANENGAVAPEVRRFRALILDDDAWALRLIRYVLEEALPGVIIEERQTPDIRVEEDEYVLIDMCSDGELHELLPDPAAHRSSTSTEQETIRERKAM